MAVGDTSRYEDIKIDRVNVNRYAYLNNKFPVEIIASYSGTTEKATQLTVYSGKKKVFRNKLNSAMPKVDKWSTFTYLLMLWVLSSIQRNCRL